MKNFVSKFKRIFVLLLIIPVMFVFAACGKDEDKITPNNGNTGGIEQPSGNEGETETPTEPDDDQNDDSESGEQPELPQPGPEPEVQVEKFSVEIDYNLPVYISDLLPDETKTVEVKEGYVLPTFENTEYEEFLEGWYFEKDNSKIETASLVAEKDETVSIYAMWKEQDIKNYFCTPGLTFEYDNDEKSAKPIAYTGTSSIVVIPQGVKYLGETPYYVETIGESCFKDNQVVKEIRTYLPDFYVEDNAFEGSTLEKIEFEKVISIGTAAFKNSNISGEVKFSSALNEVSAEMFYGCDDITNVDFFEVDDTFVTDIPAYSFYNCSKISNIKLSNTIIKIEEYAFSGCSMISDFSFVENSSVERLGRCSFENCTSLQNITIPSRIVSYGTMIFNGSTNIKNVTLSRLFYNSGYSKNTFSSWYGNLASSLETIVLKNDVTTIYEKYFASYTNLVTADISTVTLVEDKAFSKCSKLENITFSTSSDFNGDNICISAFYDTKWYADLENSMTDSVVINDSLIYVKSTFTGEFVVGNNVKYICENSFNNKPNLTSVKISATVIDINKNAFRNAGLTSISVDDNNELYAVQSGVVLNAESDEISYYSLFKVDIVDSGNGEEVIPVSLLAYASDMAGGVYVVPETVTIVYDAAFDSTNAPEYIFLNSASASQVVFNGNSSNAYIFANSNISVVDGSTTLVIYRYMAQEKDATTNYYEIEVDDVNINLAYPIDINYLILPNKYNLAIVSHNGFVYYYLISRNTSTMINLNDVSPNFSI